MEPQILLPAQQKAAVSRFIELTQDDLPATLQADDLGSGDVITVKSVSGFAFGKLSFSADPADGDTFTIGNKTYTFQDTLTDVDGNIKISGLLFNTLQHTVEAINLLTGAGTNYAASTTLNPDVTAEIGGPGNVVTVSAKIFGVAPSKIPTTEVSATLSWGNSTLVVSTVDVSESGTAIELTEANNRITVNSPIRIQVEKDSTAIPIGVTIAYGDQV